MNSTTSTTSGIFALSPLDGRYQSQVDALRPFVSEAGLIHWRLVVEIQWLLFLADHKELQGVLDLTPSVRSVLLRLQDGTVDDTAKRVKEIERQTNHDVKAVEYYLREHLQAAQADRKVLAFLHFACTSEDINNIAYSLMIKHAREQVLFPVLRELLTTLNGMVLKYADCAMMSRTHGQSATPTTVGKEFAVFTSRVLRICERMQRQQLLAKMNGAVGNFNAHMVAFPDVDWPALSKQFVEEKLKLTFNPWTTQIENHDSLVEFAQDLQHLNTILIGLCRDIWSYISLGYFSQAVKAGEVGSSTMPHKVNPIDFENAEGNLGVANATAQYFAEKLPISRWQRDLSDSTVLRQFGSLLGQSLLSWKSLLKGLHKIDLNRDVVKRDLSERWELLAEPIQTVLRKQGVVDAYEQLKSLTRGQTITKESLHNFIREQQIFTAEQKTQLWALTPENYVGCAKELATACYKHVNKSPFMTSQ